MRIEYAKVFHGEININDESLVELYKKFQWLVAKRKALFDDANDNFDENNYYEFLIRKLYYEFALEEFDKIKYELENRKLKI